MQFTIDASATVDVSLRQPLALLRALRAGDTDRLQETVSVVDLEYDVHRAGE